MPTRVVLQETAPSVRPRRTIANTRPPLAPQTPNASDRTLSPRGTPGSFFRNALRNKEHDEPTNNGAQDTQTDALSDSDIRSSPRMTYYLYSLLCSCVMLISIVQFFFKEDDSAVEYRDEEHYIGNYGVYRWKLRGGFAMSAAGIIIYLLIIVAHFDTVCFPGFWASFFQDGSIGERNLILCLLLFWIGTLYLCTSVLSVGSIQANVYFVSWIGFGANVLLFDVWRTYAGYQAWGEMLEAQSETTYNWTCTLFFAIVASCGASDAWANQDELSLYVVGQADLYEKDRWTGLILAWTSVGICLVALLGNYFLTQEFSMTCCRSFQMTLDWRQFEGAGLVFLLAMYGYVLFVYTGTLGVFNSPSNTYFGIWGTFFAAVVTFGTWVKENRNFLVFSLLPASPKASSRQRQSSRQSANFSQSNGDT